MPHRSTSILHRLLQSRPLVLLSLRVAAVLIAAGALIAAWRAMSVLPWTVDGLIAVVAVLAWAYWFERGDGT